MRASRSTVGFETAGSVTVSGIAVDFEVTGANVIVGQVYTDLAGQARFTFKGLVVGADTIAAGAATFSDSASVNWTSPAPSLVITSPNEGDAFDVGSQILITGSATPGSEGTTTGAPTGRHVDQDRAPLCPTESPASPRHLPRRRMHLCASWP